MTSDYNNTGLEEVEPAEKLMHQLLHLKRYETPEVASMTRSRQNIMRQVRQVSQNKRRTLGDLLEINYPWLFAEPKYGVAMLFVAFAGLQYLGINAHRAAQSNTGIYTTPTERYAAYEQSSNAAVTNSVDYPAVPQNLRLFGDPSGQPNKLTPAGYLYRER